MAEPKRRLPVLRNTPAEEEGEPPRPPWQWIGFGVAATFGAWVPLQYLAEAVAQRTQRAFIGEPEAYEDVVTAFAALSKSDYAKLMIAVVGARIVPLLIAPFAGGYLMGRWGAEKVGVREAALSGVASALVVTLFVFAMPQPASILMPLILFAVVVPMAALGGRLGLKKRAREMTPNVK